MHGVHIKSTEKKQWRWKIAIDEIEKKDCIKICKKLKSNSSKYKYTKKHTPYRISQFAVVVVVFGWKRWY